MPSAIPTATRRYLRSLGRFCLLLLLTCFSLGVEEAEQEWGGVQGTNSGPESSRRGRINRGSPAAYHLYRAAGGLEDTGDGFVFDATSFDLLCSDLAIAGAPGELSAECSPVRAAGSGFNRGPPLRLL